MNKRKGLGRGLDALLGGDEAPRDSLTTLPVARIRPGRYQPRTRMDQEALAELAASIQAQGLMQPVLVRPVDRDRYELIAGERRWRAAQMAGLQEVPALVREVADEAALAMSLIENIQRENLNPMEEAAGLQDRGHLAERGLGHIALDRLPGSPRPDPVSGKMRRVVVERPAES